MADERKVLLDALIREMPWYISAAVRFQIAVADQLEMPLTDVHAIGALLELGPVGVRRLAEVMGMTTGAATRLVDRLERAGYVRREADPDDRRRLVLRVNEQQLGQISQYYEPMGDRWERQVEDYSDDQLEFLLEFLRRGRESAQLETAAVRAAGRAHGTRQRKAR